jgi:hypothetical protein
MKPFSLVAAAIFVLVALVHLYRVVVGFPVMIGGTSLGPVVSWAGLVVASAMAVGLIREAMTGNPHDIVLVADFDPPGSTQIAVRAKTPLSRGSKGHRFKFELEDRTNKDVMFDKLTAADDCSTCPPNGSSDQIYGDQTHNGDSPRWAEFWNKNNQPRPRPMDVSYQWTFTCADGFTVLPFDPIISNGGRV